MKNRSLFLLLALLPFSLLLGQSAEFEVMLEPVDIPELGGIQSYAFGQYNGKWLIVGGRLDGLHRRQPWASFDIAGHNNQLLVVDPLSKQKWTAPLNTLPLALQEQLSSTNMSFLQEGEYLYVLGGYGYSIAEDDHTTYGKLTAIHLPTVINGIINGESIVDHFRQVDHPQFAVAGGRLAKIYDTYYLVGGQKFIGRYNPMGPNMGPGFIQEYTNQVRRFRIMDDGESLVISHLESWTDSVNLHRRDYNVTPQIMPDGQQGLTAFSGVFQYDVDLPYLDCVNIDTAGFEVNDAFSQYYNHYHCANLPLYSESENVMHTLFFGGIAQFYEENGSLVQDNDVPFVKTIARVSRDGEGQMAEYKMPVEMPDFLGAGSEFLPNESLPAFSNGVIKLDSLSEDTTLLGYIYGGIASSGKNIFWINDGSQSQASSQIFKVFLKRENITGPHTLNPASLSTLDIEVFPNPNSGLFTVKYQLQKATAVKMVIHDSSGKIVEEQYIPKAPVGEQVFQKKLEHLTYGSIFFLTIETDFERRVRKIVIGE